jgi:hypothetical protein
MIINLIFIKKTTKSYLKTTQNLNGILRNNTWNIFSIYIYINFTSNKLKIKIK